MLSKTFDPANRLVADTLEAEWNGKLRALNEAQQEYERLRQTDHLATDEAQRARIAALASDFPRLWCNGSRCFPAWPAAFLELSPD